MLNVDRFRDEILKIMKKSWFAVNKDGTVISCLNIPCSECIFNSGNDCYNYRCRWLLSEAEEEGEMESAKENNHNYYGGQDNIYEAIKIINAWNLNFNLGNVIKYCLRAGRKEGNTAEQDLKKAKSYIEYELERKENER